MKSVRRKRSVFIIYFLTLFLLIFMGATAYAPGNTTSSGPILIMTLDGPINPAMDDFLRTSIDKAQKANAMLLIVRLNTPGGLLPSMQTMVERMLESPVPIVVYVTPSGGGAISAGVFITLAGHVAVMAPGTTIGAAHPVTGGGQDIQGDMREKIENFAVSLIKAISEQRGRNVQWAEKAVRESVAITDREALEEKVIDFIASDMDKLLTELEGRTVNVKGESVTLSGVRDAPQVELDMSFKQLVVNILSDPNIAILLGLGALLGIGIELYHPGAVLPGIVGVICLVLSLTAAQVLPINYGGLALLLLGAGFFAAEFFIPSFGIWGVAGIICLVLGSIYFIDTDMVWSVEGFEVDRVLVGSIAAFVGIILAVCCYLVVKSSRRKVSTGKRGLIGQTAVANTDFEPEKGSSNWIGKVQVMGELWNGIQQNAEGERIASGDKVRIVELEGALTLIVEKLSVE